MARSWWEGRAGKGYHKLSAADKRARTRTAARPNPTRCPACEAAVQPRDLLGHLERCPGPAEPHPADDRVTFAQAVAMGAPRSSLSRWDRDGLVRTSGEPGEKRYLLRDLAKVLAARSRQSRERNQRPMRQRINRGGTMNEPIGDEVSKRLQAMADEVGGVEPLSRRLDLPPRTLRNALSGAKMRRGTRVLIEMQLAQAGRPGKRAGM